MFHQLFYTPILRAGWVLVACTMLTWAFRWWVIYGLVVIICTGLITWELNGLLPQWKKRVVTALEVFQILKQKMLPTIEIAIVILEGYSLAYLYNFPLPILCLGIAAAFFLERIRPYLPKVDGNYNIVLLVIIQMQMLKAKDWVYATLVLIISEGMWIYGDIGLTKNLIRIIACSQISQTVFDTLIPQ